VARDPDAPTGLYFVTHGPAGHVFTYRRKGSAASLMSPDWLEGRLPQHMKFLHASGISQAISPSAAGTVMAAISAARAAGARVSYDTNFRPRLWTASEAAPVISAAASKADILKTSAEDCEALIGLKQPENIAAHFLALGAGAVILTLGRDGAFVADARQRVRIPGFTVEAVDATGAGDAFTGALLSELAAGRSLVVAARFANAAAALSTLDYGAIAPLPDRRKVEAFLAGV
jgi:2-dehydro-3-deoxygluconokinase